jgi:hypothetical protein
MWLKARKLNALLAPLGPVIGGQLSGGRELAKQASMDALLARAQSAVEERLRAASTADYRSLVEAKMREAEDRLRGA